MKYVLFFFIVLLFAQVSNGQEKYFYDLQGLEDSTGTTHLFYRMFDPDYNQSHSVSSNHIYHFDKSSNSDSLFLLSRFLVPIHSGSYNLIGDYIFLDNSLSSLYYITYDDDQWGNSYNFIKASDSSFFHGGHHHFNSLNKINLGNESQLVIGLDTATVVVTLGDSLKLPSIYYDYPILVKSINDFEECIEDYCILGASDTVTIFNSFIPIPIENQKDSSLFFQKNDSLFISYNGGKTINFLNSDLEWNSINKISHLTEQFFYALTDNRYRNSERIITYDSYSLFLSEDNGISWEEFYSDSNRIFVSAPFNSQGVNYFGSGNKIYSWSLDDNIVDFLELENKLTGLYTGNSTSYLYILTTKELIELNIETTQQNVLKVLPVSNYLEPEVPASITLHQNFPNPFNPNTIIRYDLETSSYIKLAIFDVLGRQVALLEDGFKPSGNYSTTFDASSLSSGIYYYMLKTVDSEQYIVRKMTLIK